MKRYLVFAGKQYYPDGGWEDLRIDGDTIEECVAWIVKYGQRSYSNQDVCEWNFNWLHIIDTTTGKVCFTKKSLDNNKLFHITNPDEKLEENDVWDKNSYEISDAIENFDDGDNK